jgi:hypothetical protein
MSDLRRAARSDIPVLSTLIEQSVRALHPQSYTPAQIDLALADVYGVDTTLIDDGTYFVVEDQVQVVACGGWSRRATLYGGDRFAGRMDDLLDPALDAAKIRAFFVHPDSGDGVWRPGCSSVARAKRSPPGFDALSSARP